MPLLLILQAAIMGATDSNNFPTQNPYQGYYSGNFDAFISKLTPRYWLRVEKSSYGSVTSDPPGINCYTYDSYCTEEFLKDQAITLNAMAETFSTFVGWSGGGCSGTGSCVVSMTDDITVTAVFQSFTLTIQKNGTGSGSITSAPPGIDCGPDCSELYGQGQYITLTPIPGLLSTLVGWSGGGCSGNGICVVNLMKDITVTATFDVSPVEGIVGTQITVPGTNFGIKKGKVLIGDTSAKIINWTPSSITFEVTKPLFPESYSVTLAMKEPKGIKPIIIPGAFIMMAPGIVSVDPSGKPGVEKTILGNYFGTKKGKIYLGDPITGKNKKCKITYWYMDPSNGTSTVRFLVPKPKGYVPGVPTQYDLKLTNKVGTASATFIIE